MRSKYPAPKDKALPKARFDNFWKRCEIGLKPRFVQRLSQKKGDSGLSEAIPRKGRKPLQWKPAQREPRFQLQF